MASVEIKLDGERGGPGRDTSESGEDLQPVPAIGSHPMSHPTQLAAKTVSSHSFRFIAKNETGMQIPDHFMPGRLMSGYSSKLVKVWVKLLVRMAAVLGYKPEFSVGFIFSSDVEAQYEVGTYGNVFYLNPATVVEQSSSRSRSLRKRWKLTQRNKLITLALHEMVHGLGYRYHDEAYANVLTDMAARVMDNRQLFNECFQ